MTISEHLTEFGGFRVQSWEPGQPLGDPQTTIHRIAVEWEDQYSWVEKFRTFLELPGVEQIQGLVVGWWNTEDPEPTPTEVIEALVVARQQLPRLRILFFGDITYDENEISWIIQGDLSPLLAAYSQLTHLGVRGGNELSLGQLDLPALRHLIIQSGGLPVQVVREVMKARLPQLEHLELYLGTENYGATTQLDDLSPILDGQLFPELKYLGLKNSDLQDQIAQLLADAPVLNQLDELDLSLGCLSDEGAQPLLHSPAVKRLKKLHLQYHTLTDEMQQQLKTLGPEVDLSRPQDPNEQWRFVAIGE